MKIILSIIIMLISSITFGSELDDKLDLFVNKLYLEKTGIIIGKIKHIHTGKEFNISDRIRISIIKSFKEKFKIIYRSEEIEKEQENSAYGYVINQANYLLNGTYDIKKDNVILELKILLVDKSELIESKEIIISRSSVEMYLKDYSYFELNSIIEKQDKEIAELLRKHEEENAKAIKFKQIKRQKEVIYRIENNDPTLFVKKDYDTLVIAYAFASFGAISLILANQEESKKNDTGGTATNIGIGCLGVSGYLFYRYFSKDYNMSIVPSYNKITFMVSNKF